MLKTISWQEFLFFMAAAALLYYACILLFYYRKDMQSGYKTYRSKINNNSLNLDQAQPTYLEHLLAMTMDATDAIRDYLKQNEFKTETKDQLLQFLKSVVLKNKALKSTPFMVQLNRFILKEAEQHKITSLNEEEINDLWVDAG